MRTPRLIIVLVGFLFATAIVATPGYMRGEFFSPASALNSPPVASNDNYTKHGSGTIGPLLQNDFDPDGDPMSVQLLTYPTRGQLFGLDGNSFSYRLDNNTYTGTDSFTYRACAGTCSDAAIVTITFVNGAPVGNNDSYTVHGGTIIGPMLANDSDPDGDIVGFTFNTGASHGIVYGLANPNPDDVKQYVPNHGYTGTDSFTYKACDGFGLCSPPVTVTLNVVNKPPVPGPDFYVVRGDNLIGPLMANDSDPEGDYLIGPSVTVGASHGTVMGLADPNPADVKQFLPNAGFAGIDSFQYAIGDYLGASATTTVTLFVLERDDAENAGPTSCNARTGEPVNVTNGNMYLQQTDYHLPGVGPELNIARTYNSKLQKDGLFGRGWSTVYDASIKVYDATFIRLNLPDGRAVYFTRPNSSSAFAPVEKDFHGHVTQSVDGDFTLSFKDGSTHQFGAAGKLLSLADRYNNQTSLTYDAGGKLLSASDPFGRIVSFTTNTNGHVLSISDTMGTIATYTYGAERQLLSTTYADNSAFQFSYDGSSRLTSVTDALGNVLESHTYDSLGRALTSEKQGGVERYTLNYVSDTQTDVTDALGHVTKYTFDKSKGRNVVTRVEGICSCGGSSSQIKTWTYDTQLNVSAKTNGLGQTTTYTYDANGNRLSATGVLGSSSYTYNELGQVLTTTDAMGGVTTNAFDAAGNLVSVKDALNNRTTFTYNQRGELLTMSNALGKVTTLAYDASGNIKQATDALGGVTKFAYDARGRLTNATDALNFVTSYDYDAAGRVNEMTRPDLSSITFTYDLAGRRTKVTDAMNNSTSFAYDGAYRLTGETDALGKSVSYTYDLMSNLTAATDQLGRTTNVEYDDFNRPIKTILPPAVAGATRLQETITYDAVGNVASRTDQAGRVSSFEYDTANRLVKVTDPALQITRYEYNARSNVTALVDAINQRYTFDYDALGRATAATRAGLLMSFAYDAVGNRIQRTDYNNLTTGYTYDALNRLSKVTYPDASMVNYGYDKLSQLTSAANVNGTVGFTYDNMGRATSTTDVFGQVLNYTYDANGRRTDLSFGAITNASYAYDAVNRLTTITDNSNLTVSYVYDETSKLTSRTLPNSVATTYTYDGLDRLTQLNDAKRRKVIADNQYSYNNAGDITQNIDQSGTHAYGYDVLDRLTSATYTGTAAESYAYDGVGNRTTSHKSVTYGYQPFNRLTTTTTASYIYNNNGNMILKSDTSGTTQFVWDFENRLTQVVTPSSGSVIYKYDALGRRIQRTPTSGVSTNFVHDGQDVVKDINSDGSTVEYLNGPGVDNKIRQMGSANKSTYYFGQNHLGSTTALTDPKGQLVERITYDGYGNSTGSARTRYDFTGRERDSDSGLLYYRARWYDPQVGRFISEDPIGLAGGINAFAYVSNSPQNRTDPSGLYDVDVHYYLTYYLALKTGCFSDADARLIAEGNQDSDESDRKKPGWGNFIGWSGQPTIVPDYAQRYRNIAFHTFGTPAQNTSRAAELRAQAYSNGGNPFLFGTYLHFLQDSFSHRDFAGNNTWGQATGGQRVDHTNFDPKKAMDMARATFDALLAFGKRNGCGCNGEPDWKVVQDFIDVGYARWNPLDFGWQVSDAQLRRKIQILGLPWRSSNGR
ncbi:MAG: Ig-like domain-containing protein [Pyrinomonadaceae bacterium]